MEKARKKLALFCILSLVVGICSIQIAAADSNPVYPTDTSVYYTTTGTTAHIDKNCADISGEDLQTGTIVQLIEHQLKNSAGDTLTPCTRCLGSSFSVVNDTPVANNKTNDTNTSTESNSSTNTNQENNNTENAQQNWPNSTQPSVESTDKSYSANTTVYYTKSGKKFHFDKQCATTEYNPEHGTLIDAIKGKLRNDSGAVVNEPCDTCVTPHITKDELDAIEAEYDANNSIDNSKDTEELVDEENTDENIDKNIDENTTNNNTSKSNESPKTGDNNLIFIYLIIFILSGLSIITIMLRKFRK